MNKSDTCDLLQQVNLNHLLYFWAVGEAGSVTAAAERLGISQPGVTKQLRLLEKRLGVTLFERGRRGVVLTGSGRRAMLYAEEAIGACTKLIRTAPESGAEIQRPIFAGTADSVPKIVIRRILKPLMEGVSPPSVICREWRIDHLLAELSLHRIDLVISDTPISTPQLQSLVSYSAMQSGCELYAARDVAKKLRRGYPGSLSGAPVLLPAEGTPVRAGLDRWFARHRIRPRIAAEAEDRSLLHHLAEEGLGVTPVATITARDVARQYGLARVGIVDNVREEYFVITAERPNEHQALSKLRDRGKNAGSAARNQS